MSIFDKALFCLKLAKEKKAINPRLLDMEGRSSIADFVLLCSASSERQVKAIADSLLKELKKIGTYALGVEGHSEGKWILVDYGDIIVHIFYDEARNFYNIEGLYPFASEIKA